MAHATETGIAVETKARIAVYLSVIGVMIGILLFWLGVSGGLLLIAIGAVVGAVGIYSDMQTVNREVRADYTPWFWGLFALVTPGISGALYLSDRRALVGHW